MNTINLIGNICNDLELKQTNNGKSVLNFNLAVKRPRAKDTTDFIPVTVWNQPAEFLAKYAHKGSRIAVSGSLTTRKWQDNNGNNRISYEVTCDSAELLDSKQEGDGETNYTSQYRNAVQSDFAASGGYVPDAYTNAAGNIFPPNAGEDDLPF